MSRAKKQGKYTGKWINKQNVHSCTSTSTKTQFPCLNRRSIQGIVLSQNGPERGPMLQNQRRINKLGFVSQSQEE